MITVIEWGSELAETPSVFVGSLEAGAIWAATTIAGVSWEAYADELVEFDLEAIGRGEVDVDTARAFIGTLWECTTDAWVGHYEAPPIFGEAVFDSTPW